MQWSGLLFVGIGMFAIRGAALDWDWFMNSRKARVLVRFLGRGGRIFYALLGLGIFVFGILYAAGIIRDAR
jgi:hypothetical protein